jgi:hypothetical protein
MRDSKYNKNVFINCPFDKEYDQIFQAIVFAIHDCGFFPICMKGTCSEIRLYKILEKMENCKFAIHDLSRQELHKPPRFNMPFELGLFIGCQQYKDDEKEFLVLDSKKYAYQKIISDILGIDPEYHKNNPKIAINKVRNWLRSYEAKEMILAGPKIWERYQEFRRELPRLCRELGYTLREFMNDFNFIDYSNFITGWIKNQDRNLPP